MNDKLSIDQKKEIDSICDQFESQWKSGNRPDLSEFVGAETESPTETLLLELIQIDMHYRRQRGETPDARDYLAQFPDHSEVILKLSVSNEITAEIRRVSHEHSPPDSPPTRFGRYELDRELGKGGFGVVWRALDTELDLWVALKIARVGDSPEIHQLFRKEARAMAALSHPHVVRVIHFDIEDNLAFIVSDLIEGESLARHVEQRDLSIDESLQIAIQIATGLEHVHEQGVVHRDLKPGNILLNQDNVPVIADFGLARQASTESTIVQPGQVVGTIPYMSPEQLLGQPIDHTTDIYSLGVILYRLITGRCPFEGSRAEIRHQVINELPRNPSDLNPEVSRSLSDVCLKAMSRDPRYRYATAGAFRHDLEALLAGETVVVKSPWLQTSPFESIQGNRRKLLTTASALGGIGFVGYLIKTFWFVPGPPSGNRDTPFAPVTAPFPPTPPPDVEIPVTLETFPTGAHVVLHPIDYQTGRPQPELRKVVNELTPAKVMLRPGDYLVVAYLDDGRFHEVYRHVPGPDGPGAFAPLYGHTISKMVDGRVTLPRVILPKEGESITAGMTRVSGKAEFALPPYYPTERLRRYSVPEFFVDLYEFTQGQRRDSSVSERDRDRHIDEGPNYPLRKGHNFDDFVSRAEYEGKRLLTDLEYYYVATNAGTTKYPWGNSMHSDAADVESELLPVGTPDWDKTLHDPPVYGLCSGVAEWVDSQPLHVADGKELPILAMEKDHFVIKGGNDEVLLGNLQVIAEGRDPRPYISRNRTTKQPGLGCRFARSAKPRLKPEDFVTEFAQE